MDSVWEKAALLPEFPQLEGDLRTDVLVIGGGLAGILCAWHLNRAGVECTLIEENRLMHGVSGRTTAKLTSQHGLIYGKLLSEFGPEKARLYWQANEEALSAFRTLASEADCDFETQSNFLYQRDAADKLERERSAIETLKIPYVWEDSLPLPFPVAGAIGFADQAQFHPLKLAEHLCGALKIYEHTKALEFLGNRVVCHSIPIRPGRNLAIIVESASINHRQKQMGYNAAQELYRRLQDSLAKKNRED